MSSYEPSSQEVSTTLNIGSLIGFFYAGYIHRLDLKGSERVLDFGSGSGVCSKHLAARLEKGGGRLTCVDVSRTWNRVIQNTLRRFRNVETCVADLTVSSDAAKLPDNGFDALFIHFVLHDIPAGERPIILRRLAEKLIPNGKLYLREPLEPGGMTAEKAHKVIETAGFREISWRIEKKWYVGTMMEGVFQK